MYMFDVYANTVSAIRSNLSLFSVPEFLWREDFTNL